MLQIQPATSILSHGRYNLLFFIGFLSVGVNRDWFMMSKAAFHRTGRPMNTRDVHTSGSIMNKGLSSLAVVMLCMALPLQASTDDWSKRKDKDGIQVYTRSVEGSPHKAVKAETVVDKLRLSSLAALLMDAEACPDWADRCAESYVHEQLSDTEFYVYSDNDMPFPVKDRDALAHVKWSQNKESLEVLMTSVATTGILAKRKGRLRLTEARTSWRFTPLPDGSVRVSNESHINPGSALPGWVTNMLLVDTPHKTMRAFIEEASAEKYRDAKVSFIQEPTGASVPGAQSFH